MYIGGGGRNGQKPSGFSWKFQLSSGNFWILWVWVFSDEREKNPEISLRLVRFAREIRPVEFVFLRRVLRYVFLYIYIQICGFFLFFVFFLFRVFPASDAQR